MKCSRCGKDVGETKIISAIVNYPDNTRDGRSCALCNDCLKEVKTAARAFIKCLDSAGKKRVKK